MQIRIIFDYRYSVVPYALFLWFVVVVDQSIMPLNSTQREVLRDTINGCVDALIEAGCADFLARCIEPNRVCSIFAFSYPVS